jgi:DNA-binding MarR family transcriptional regulator
VGLFDIKLSLSIGGSSMGRGNKDSGGRKAAQAATAPVEYGPLGGWVGFPLRMAQEAAFQAFRRRSREIGENPGRFAILTLIGQNPGISQTTLSQASGRDKSSMTPVLEDLVRRGLVKRERTNADRRTYRLKLTPAGVRTLGKLNVCAREHEKNLDRIIGTRDRANFLRVLRRIAEAIN